ncbi:PLP-dependent transferase [Lophiostoma macrostomum CBS 122681]|uniref:PLP-dependent transferase n=1 Tax=Lophiostoma macrostomum CBS 122681 TaxID=1314788 RepID=A0A6A6TGR0_9PLEO|nr:PLP-dependent transferase [Lophiostoma macrostomum CBS 122681]
MGTQTQSNRYEYQIKLAGGTIRYVPLRSPEGESTGCVSGNDWNIDIEELEQAITPQTKMIYLNNPHNPLRKVFTRSELTAIGNLCVAHGLVLLSDEVYERIVFPSESPTSRNVPHTRVASLSPEIAAHTLTAISLAKLFNATGWRVGFIVGPEELMRPVIGTHLVLAYSSSGPAQDACVVGLREAERIDWWSTNARDVGARVGKLCHTLDKIGLTYVAPPSAWFIFIRIHNIMLPEGYKYFPLVVSHGSQDWKVCYFLVHEFGISCIPGSCFYGPENKALGEQYLRLGACKSDDGLDLAARRFERVRPYIRDI